MKGQWRNSMEKGRVHRGAGPCTQGEKGQCRRWLGRVHVGIGQDRVDRGTEMYSGVEQNAFIHKMGISNKAHRGGYGSL